MIYHSGLFFAHAETRYLQAFQENKYFRAFIFIRPDINKAH